MWHRTFKYERTSITIDHHLNGQLMSSLLIFMCTMSHGTIRYTWKVHACFFVLTLFVLTPLLHYLYSRHSYIICTHATLTLFVLTPLLHYLYSRHSCTICTPATLTLFVLTPLLLYLYSLHSYTICTHSTLTLFVLTVTPLLHYLYSQSLHSYTICTHSIQIFTLQKI